MFRVLTRKVNWFFFHGFFFPPKYLLIMPSKFSFSVPSFSKSFILLLWCQWRQNILLLRIRKQEVLKMNIPMQDCNHFIFFNTTDFRLNAPTLGFRMAADIFLTTYIQKHTKWNHNVYSAVPNTPLKKKPKQIKQTEQITQNHISNSPGEVNNFINSKA